MTAPHDIDRQLQAFLRDGPTELPDPSFDAVRDRIEGTRQRVVIGPWRMPALNKLVPLGAGVAAVAVALVIASQLLGPSVTPGVGGGQAAPTPSASPSPTPIANIVRYQLDGAPATTEVDVVADGASVTRRFVTTMGARTHTVRLECTARSGDTWAIAGTIENTTVAGERAGDWSAVVVKDGSPQRIAIWLSDPKSGGSDCAGWLGSITLADIGDENFQPVESGALVQPSDLAP